MHVSDRTGRPIKLHNLHVLVSVIQAGGMGRAARRLNTSQSAISRSIAELEHAFGVRLLDRSRQGVEPTQYGRVLLGCAAAVFDELRQGAKSIEPPFKILPVKLSMPPLPVGIMTLKNRTISPVARLFIDRTRELARPLAKQRR